MNRLITLSFLSLSLSLSACSDSGTSSGGGSGEDASGCVKRTFDRIYTNTCDYDVNVILLEADATAFSIDENDAVSRSSSGASFGACRAPSIPVLNDENNGYTCS